MQILLHIGQSKTGTSAIQAYLTLNRLRLVEAGVLYPGVTIGGMPVDLGSHNSLADALSGLSRFPNMTVDQYFGQFFDKAKRIDAERMILSGEHFFGGEPRIWNVLDEKTYLEKYKKKIEVLSRYLAGHEVTLLIYLRPQVDWLASAISQTVRIEPLIKSQPIYHDDYQFFELAKPVLRYCSLIDIWVEYLRPLEVMVIPYERKLLYRMSSIADFLCRAGLEKVNLPFGDEELQVNKSLSWEYIEVKKILNRIPKSKNDERVIIKSLERLSARTGNVKPYRISRELSREVEEFVAQENIDLNERYVKTDAPLKAHGAALNESDMETLHEDKIAVAWTAFKKEYARPYYRLLKLDYAFRECLRQHAGPLHSLLHQLKRLYRAFVYRK